MPYKKTTRIYLKYGLLFLLSINMIGCISSKRKYLISESKFIDILVDIHIADAIAQENNPEISGYKLDSANVYGSIFANHGVTGAQFDSTMNYYSFYPEDFQNIYNTVTSRLNQLTDTIIKSDAERVRAQASSEIVWKSPTVFALPEMGNAGRVEINVPIKETGTYTIEINVKLYTDDESEDPHLTACFWYDDHSKTGCCDSFPVVYLKKDGEQLSYSTTKSTEDTLVTHIKGYVLDNANTDTLFKQHALVSEIKITRIL